MSISADYDAWYQSTRGSWIGQQEFSILLKLFTPKAGHSLLYYKKKQSAGYLGARWDTISDEQQWCNNIKPELKMMTKSAVWISSADIIAQILENLLPAYLPYGGFLAVAIKNNNG